MSNCIERLRRCDFRRIHPFTPPSVGVKTPSWGWLWLRAGGHTGRAAARCDVCGARLGGAERLNCNVFKMKFVRPTDTLAQNQNDA